MSAAPNLTMPTLHMNGTGPRMLLESYVEAYLAVGAAMEAMSKIEFNGRDYYPQGEGAWKKAREEHDSRFDRLRAVKSELEEIAQHVQHTGHKP